MVDRVSVGAEDLGKPNPTGPNDAALAAKAEGTATPAQADQRPAWLPEKFKSAEDMAAAYAELEKKQSGAKPAADPTKPIEKAPAADDAAAVVKAAGLDFDDLGRQVGETGDISKEAREALIAKGIPEETINAHIEGVKAITKNALNDAYAAAGGEEQFNAMREWATKDASETQLDTYNSLIQSGKTKAAMEYLKGAYEGANGTQASRRVEGTANGAPSNDVYTSRAQVTADMRDPRYKSDAAFRAQVEAKLGRSKVI